VAALFTTLSGYGTEEEADSARKLAEVFTQRTLSQLPPARLDQLKAGLASDPFYEVSPRGVRGDIWQRPPPEQRPRPRPAGA